MRSDNGRWQEVTAAAAGEKGTRYPYAKDTANLQNPTIDRDNLSQKIELPLFPN